MVNLEGGITRFKEVGTLGGAEAQDRKPALHADQDHPGAGMASRRRWQELMAGHADAALGDKVPDVRGQGGTSLQGTVKVAPRTRCSWGRVIGLPTRNLLINVT